MGERLEILQNERLQAVAQVPHERPAQKAAVNDLRTLGLKAFWAQDDRTVNQMLLALFGEFKLLVFEGQIIGTDIGTKRKLPRSRVTK